jgi:hypothetical protein
MTIAIVNAVYVAETLQRLIVTDVTPILTIVSIVIQAG